MKVCILTSVHPPFDTRIFHKEAKSLRGVGYEVILIAQHKKEETVDGIKIIPLKKPRNRVERMTKIVWQAYRAALTTDADIYHFHDPELIPIGLLLKGGGKKVIYDIHEDAPKQNLSKTYIPKYLRKPISFFIEAIEAFSANRFDGIITATPFINERFLKMGANAVNINNYPIVSELSVEDSNWENKEKAVCYVGGIAEIRGAVEMVEAIGRTDYRLILAGDFEPGLEERLRQLHGWKNVESLGFVDRNGVRDVMSRSMTGLVILHPTINYIDSLPVKMFEYMSAGLPVIASNFPLWKEIVEGNKCGICVDPLNPREIAEAIQWMIEHPEEAKAIGENGRRAAEEKYNWEFEEAKLLSLYQRLLNS